MTAAPAAEPGHRASGGAPRPSLLLIGGGGALVALVLGLLAVPGPLPLAAGVLVVQVLLVLSLLTLIDAPGRRGTLLIAGGAALAADVLVLLDGGAVSGLAGVVALSLVAALVHQLARRDRARVTEALADTVAAVVLVGCAACLPALRALDGSRSVVLAALAAAGAALLVGRLVDRLLPRPALVHGARRGWPGLVAGLAAAAGAAGVVSVVAASGLGSRGPLLGVAVGAVVAAADLLADLAAVDLQPGRRHARRVAALRPVGLLLPLVAVGPVAFVAGRLVLP